MRLVSPDTGSRLSWLVGVDFRRIDSEFDILRLGRNDNTMLTPSGNPRIDNSLLETESLSNAYGVFASAGYEVLRGLTLSGSLRYSSETKDFSSMRTSFDPSAPGVIGTPIDASETFEAIDPSVTLTYEWLDYLVYGSYAQAHRSGGFNQDDPSDFSTCTTGDCLTFDQELANSYEVGFKASNLFARTSNFSLAAFRVNYEDILINQAVGVAESGFGIQFVDNFGKGYAQGVEAELNSRVQNFLDTGGNLRLQFGVTYMETKLTDIPPAVQTATIRPNDIQINRTPRWLYNANVTYRRALPFFENSGLGLFLNTNYKGEVGGLDDLGDRITRDTVRRWNAQIGIEGETRGQAWQLVAFGDNVFDIQYERRRQQTATTYLKRYNYPATYGLRLTLRGGE
ncbi:MAG: TonB-dependent receptor [Alphaproteobacteria bacterium]|nr:TonB-dependent receptor [Alphaproteobacteria bacterium]